LITAKIISIEPTKHRILIEILNDGWMYESQRVEFGGNFSACYKSNEGQRLESLKQDIEFCLTSDIDFILLSIEKGN